MAIVPPLTPGISMDEPIAKPFATRTMQVRIAVVVFNRCLSAVAAQISGIRFGFALQ
jgi:hypothetical protein